jgi:hypothetical protein
VKTPLIEASRTAHNNGETGGDAHNHRIQLLSSGCAVTFGVVQGAKCKLLTCPNRLKVKQDRRRDKRTGKRAAASLIGARNPPHSK